MTEHFGPSPLPQLCNCECHDFWKSYDADSLRELGEKMFRAFQASECASPDETIVGIEEPMRAEFVAMLETFVSSSQLTVTNETPASTSVSRPFYRTWIIVDCSRPRWWWPWVSSGGPRRWDKFTQSNNTKETGWDHWPHAFTALLAGGGGRVIRNLGQDRARHFAAHVGPFDLWNEPFPYSVFIQD